MKVRTQFGEYTIQADNAIEHIGLHKPEEWFNKLWIYPGKRNAGGTLDANAGTVYLGEDGDGQKTTPDPLAPGDLPFKIELPQGEQKKLSEVLIQGAAGDAVWFKWWPAMIALLLALCLPATAQERPSTGRAIASITVFPDGTAIAENGRKINTARSTTRGIQEALDAVSSGVISGGKIDLAPGTFFVSNSIALPDSSGPVNIVLEGAGEGMSRVVFALNTNADFIVSQGNGNQINLVIRDCGFWHLWDTNHCALLCIGANQVLCENVFFAPYQMLWKTRLFDNPLVYFDPPTNAVGTIGVKQTGGANRATFRNCAFHGLAVGLWEAADHVSVEDCIFSDCGQYQLNGAGANAWGTTYTTAANNELTNVASYGCGLALPANTYDVNVQNGQWFNCHACVYDRGNGLGPDLNIFSPMFEASATRILLGDGNDFNDPAPVAIYVSNSPGGGVADSAFLYKTGATESDLTTGHPYPVAEIWNKGGLFENGDWISRGTLAGSNIWSFSGSLDTGNWFYQGGLAVGQDLGPTTGFNFEVKGNMRLNGALTMVNSNTPPVNTSTVRSWVIVTNSGQRFYLPMYQ